MSDSTSSTSGTDNTQKALITVGVLGGCILVAIVVAKIVDYCYDHHVAISDDASDISEDTRNLIRLRLAVKAFRNKKKPPPPDTPAEDPSSHRKIIRIWSAKAKESRKIAEQRRAQEQAKSLAARADLIIRVEEASGEAKLQASKAAAQKATLTFLSETSDPGAGPSGDRKDREGVKGKSPKGSELTRTLTGLDSSAKMGDAPALVAVTASGNASVLPGKGSAAPAKEGAPKSSPNELKVPGFEGAVEAFRPGPGDGSSAASAKTPESSGGSKPAEGGGKPRGSASPRPGRPVSKPQQSPRSPSPRAKSPDPPRTKSPDPPRAKTPDPPRAKADESKSASPSAKPKSANPYNTGAEVIKPPSPPLTPSPSPGNKPLKQAVQPRAASPTKPAPDTQKAEPSKEKGKSAGGVTAAASGAKPGPVETPVKDGPPTDKPDSSASPATSTQPRPASSRKVFTVVHPKVAPAPAKASSRSPEAKAAPSSPGKGGAAGSSGSKPRPKSFHAKDSDKFSHMPPKLASSVALYGQATNDLDKHKALVSKRRAAVSPTRGMAGQSPTPGKKLEQSPIVLAAAARKARARSAKP